ncbi:MAG: hypothetical protein HC796_01755 [Synechococcaceae cyanobacterium RL_1_2]|nr:hypothetical protein [Synechococcaceae cyanobacterium RL_1_2]
MGEQSFSFEQTVIEPLEPTPTPTEKSLDYGNDATVIEAFPQAPMMMQRSSKPYPRMIMPRSSNQTRSRIPPRTATMTITTSI